MKETFKIKPPKRIAIGDPWYYERYQGKELDRLTVNFLRPNDFTAARVVLEESPIEDMPEYKSLDMTICLAPKKTIDTYLKGMYYSFQDCSERLILSRIQPRSHRERRLVRNSRSNGSENRKRIQKK